MDEQVAYKLPLRYHCAVMKPTSLDELIAKKAEEFADQVRAAAAIADKEEEIRIEVERKWTSC